MADIPKHRSNASSTPVSLEHYRTQNPCCTRSNSLLPNSLPLLETVKPPPEWVLPLEAYCLHCGYDLRGLPLGRPCSECGKPVDWPAHVERVGRYYRGGVLRTAWDMVNFFCVLPHGLWALRDPQGTGWAMRHWRAFGLASLMALLAAVFLAGGAYVESRHMVWFTNAGQSTPPVTAHIQTKKFLGGWGVVSNQKGQTPVAPGPDWTSQTAVQKTLRFSVTGIHQDVPILLALNGPLLLAAIGMAPMRRLILCFSVVEQSDPASRRWLRERLSPVWLGFVPAAVLVAIGMGVQLSWPMWPAWIPDKAKEFVIVWLPNAALLIPPYFAMRILSADYTRRLFPNRWWLGGVTLAFLVTGPWITGQVLYWIAMAMTYPIGSPLTRLPALWPF